MRPGDMAHRGSGDTVKDKVCRASELRENVCPQELLVLGTGAKSLHSGLGLFFCVQHKHLLFASDLTLPLPSLFPPPNLASSEELLFAVLCLLCSPGCHPGPFRNLSLAAEI